MATGKELNPKVQTKYEKNEGFEEHMLQRHIETLVKNPVTVLGYEAIG
jgi:hypothetical protein